MDKCRVCGNQDLFRVMIKNKDLYVCATCFCVLSETSSNKQELPSIEISENIVNGFKVNDVANRYVANTINFIGYSMEVELLHDRSQYLSYSPLLDNYFLRTINKISDTGILIIELYPVNPLLIYFKNIDANPYNYFSTKSMKLLVENYGMHLLSTIYLSSMSHQLFIVGKNPDLYPELNNINQVIKLESAMGNYNLASYKDVQTYYITGLTPVSKIYE